MTSTWSISGLLGDMSKSNSRLRPSQTLSSRIGGHFHPGPEPSVCTLSPELYPSLSPTELSSCRKWQLHGKDVLRQNRASHQYLLKAHSLESWQIPPVPPPSLSQAEIPRDWLRASFSLLSSLLWPHQPDGLCLISLGFGCRNQTAFKASSCSKGKVYNAPEN